MKTIEQLLEEQNEILKEIKNELHTIASNTESDEEVERLAKAFKEMPTIC